MIEAVVAIGPEKGRVVFCAQTNLQPSDDGQMLFTFVRRQFCGGAHHCQGVCGGRVEGCIRWRAGQLLHQECGVQGGDIMAC